MLWNIQVSSNNGEFSELIQGWIKGCQIVPSLWLHTFFSSDCVFFDGENDRFENTR